MNINPVFPPIVTTLPPIVNRRVNVVHRVHIVNQPIINEEITQICNHNIKRNIACDRPICCEQSTFREEFSHIGRCGPEQGSGVGPAGFAGPGAAGMGQAGPGQFVGFQ